MIAAFCRFSPPDKHRKMARGRFLSLSISTNEQLSGVSLLADYLFTRCIPHLDAAGRISGNPTLIKARVVPLRSEITERSIPKLVAELEAATDHEGRPLVVAYEVAGQRVLEFPGFERQQVGLRMKREPPSRFPPNPAKSPASSRQDDGNSPPNRRQSGAPREVEVEVEVEGEGENQRPRRHSAGKRPSAGKILAQIKTLAEESQVPGQGAHRFIRRARVEELGAEILAAYDAVGGADAILKTPGEKWSFLVRDFERELGATPVPAGASP